MNNYIKNGIKKRRRKAVSGLLGYGAVAAIAFYLIYFPPFHFPAIIFMILGGTLGGTGIFALIKLIELPWLIRSRPRHIYKLGNGLAFSENKDMKLCEEMAAEGYVLTTVNNLGFYKFERAEPEDCVYSVDYTDLTPCAEGFGEYIELFETGGWKHVFSCDGTHWFKAPRGTTPIYTDSASLSEKHAKMRRFSLHVVLGAAPVAAVCFIAAWFVPPLWISNVLLVSGAAVAGLGAAMLWAVVLNHRRVLRLEKRQDQIHLD